MAIIIDGRAMAARLLSSVAGKVSELRARHALHPTLAVVLIGEDPASDIYVRNKLRACRSVGIASREHRLPATTSQHELRSEEHTSELQSLMRISYAVFCLKKKTKTKHTRT